MLSRNFPAKVMTRRQGAKDRLKGPNASKFTDKLELAEAMTRYEENMKGLIAAIGSVTGNARNFRSKKNRTDRAKIK